MLNEDQSEDALKRAIKEKRQMTAQTKKDIGIAEDMETAATYRQIRDIQQASVASTERALKIAGQTEKVGVAALSELLSQGKQLDNVHDNLHASQKNAIRANEAAGTLNKYNQIIPVNLGSALQRRPAAATTKITKQNADAAAFRIAGADGSSGAASKGGGMAAATPEDEDEQRIASNVGGISRALDNLKNIADTMDSEIGRQNKVIDANARVTTQTNAILSDADKKTKKFLGK